MAQVMLDSSGILAVIGQLVAAAMAQHMAVDEEPEPRCFTGTRNHALIASNAQRRATLADEHVSAWRLGFPL